MYYVGVEDNTHYARLICVDKAITKKACLNMANNLLTCERFLETIFCLQSFPQKACELSGKNLLAYCLDNYFTVVTK